MYTKNYATGSNLFDQWCGCSDRIIQEFTLIKHVDDISGFDMDLATLVHIGWSHNIYQCNGCLYITGDYKLSRRTIETLELPDIDLHNANCAITSNDSHIVVVNKDKHTILTVDLETKHFKLFNLSTEVPLISQPKRFKNSVHIVKCVATLNNMILYLSMQGLVYSGVPPTLVDTEQCEGSPVDIQCGYEHFVILTDTGKVYTWGEGRRLQLGHGDTSSLHSPTLVTAIDHIVIKQIAAGGWHTMCLSTSGDIYVWGWNDSGQLGIKSRSNNEIGVTSYAVPTWVELFDEDGTREKASIIDIACGSKHSVVLLSDHTVWTCGINKYGQLGFPIHSHSTIHSFKKNSFFKNAQNVMCGQWSTVVKCEL